MTISVRELREHGAVLTDLFTLDSCPMLICDAVSGRLRCVNDAAVARWGYTRERLVTLGVADLLVSPPPRGEDLVPLLAGERRLRLADGRLLDVELHAHAFGEHRQRRIVVFADDISSRKHAEAALRQTEERYRTVVDSLRQVIFQVDLRGTWTFLNAAWTDMTGFSVEETVGTSFLNYVHADDLAAHAEVFQALVENRSECFGHVARYVTRAGSHRWVEVFEQLAVEPDGTIQGVFGTLTDITERRQAEDELKAVRARLQHLLSSSPAIVYSRPTTGGSEITYVSDNVMRQLGWHPYDVVADPRFWPAQVHPDDRARVLSAVSAAAACSLEYRVRHQDSQYRWIHDECLVVSDAAGQPVEIVGSWVDVTAHRLAEEQRVRLSTVVEQLPDAIVITTPTGVIDYVNPACERLSGYTAGELLGQDVRVLLGHDDGTVHAMWTALAAGEVWSSALCTRRKDGTGLEVEGIASPVYDSEGRVVSYVAGMRDVSHERLIEAQLRQAQKMEIAGRLAGGVAHDFNNMLTVMTGRSQILLRKLAPDDPRRRDIELIEETAQRAAALTRQLLVFSRKQVLTLRELDINGIVAGMERMLRRLIGEDIELVTRREPAVGRVKADPSQIEQVILNLAVNARDAMPEGGRLIIETADVELDAAYARRHVDVRPGRYVMLAVQDTGTGIDTETLIHLFEPFFTTKGERGTGLGLSTVYGIVKQSDGHIAVESAPGRGSAFRVYLPRIEATAATGGARADLGAPSGSETILVAEDEDELRALALEVLRMRGYTVLEGRSGTEALERGLAHPGPIHLLLSDVVMPQMSGRELSERLQRARPEMRVLFMSGYTDDAIVRYRVSTSGAELLQKPFTPDVLAQRVRKILEAPRPIRPVGR